MWYEEKEEMSKMAVNPTFSLRYQGGKVLLPLFKGTPPSLNNLLNYNHPATSKFRDQIRVYNNMFCFTSFGAKIDHSINTGRALYTFRINRQNYHRMRSLLPKEGIQPKFAKLYFFDTQNEVRNRTGVFIDKDTAEPVDEQIVQSLIQMLDEYSSVAKAFRMAIDWCNTHNMIDFHLRLHSDEKISRQYNAPTISEVAAIIINDFGDGLPTRDIIVSSKYEGLHTWHSNTICCFCMGKMASMRKYLIIIIQAPRKQSDDLRVIIPTIYSGCIHQQYLVDTYTAVEEQRLKWKRNNQDTLRVELYHNLCDAVTRGDTRAAMALCRAYDNPSLFITLASNPKWPKIAEMLAYFPGQKAHDRPEVGTRVFKLKLTELLDDLTKKHVCICHRILEHSKCRTPSEIDDIIYAELPSPIDDPTDYKVVTENMLHGPCGKDARYAACTNDGKYSEHFPKPFLAETFLDEEGYLHYRRRDNKAVWRLFSFDIHYSYPTVMQLSFHLPNQNTITLRDSENLPALLQREGINVTMFTDWFELNKRDPAARTHTYDDIPKHYVWHEQQKLWLPRKQRKCIGRIIYSSLASGERYYLRMLLNVVWGVTGFEHLMTVNHMLYATFKKVCFAHGLLNGDREWTKALSEASLWALGPQLHDIFITMLRSERRIVLVVASSGITSLLLPAGRTAHSRFVIPLDLMENNTCEIQQNIQLAELMQEVQLIIWDEAPMAQRYAFEALDITMSIVNGEIDTLKQEFNRWVLAVGDGTLPAKMKEGEDEPTWIDILEKFLIKSWDSPIQQIVTETYPDFTSRQTDDKYLKERAILTPRNDDAEAINDFMFKQLSREPVNYTPSSS
ncbi:DNA helicase PIF1, ATP-dependent [Tanacetum coccineum]|uniref:ATP-dependent DNA helicase n=1 Tax=Tanacetum coccineum TaxID=301880 RepID=A0ABQ5CSH8_9ASTR